MRRTLFLLAAIISLSIFGCSPEKKQEQVSAPAPPEQVKLLSRKDRERILAFKKDLLNIENVSKKALSVVGDEIRLVLKGEKESFDVAALVDRAKVESRRSLDNLLKESVPEKLPPWFTQNLTDAKKGFQEGYTAKMESFAAVKRFIDEKSPTALLEYRQKEAQANKLLLDARGKLTLVLAAAGLPAGNTSKSERNSGESRQ